MPAQTHSRVRNGFHILANSRGGLTNLNGPPCNTAAQCEKAYCCGPAIQPLSSKPRGCRRGLCSFTHNRGRKRALALGGVGSRSAATKRAISRRVENRNKMAPGYVPSATRPRNMKEWPTKNATCDTPCPCCLITMTKNHPRNACLGSCARKSNSPNSLLTASPTSSASGPVGPVSSPPVALSALATTPGLPPYTLNGFQYRTIDITFDGVIDAGTKIKIKAVPTLAGQAVGIVSAGEIEFTVANTRINRQLASGPLSGLSIYTQPFKFDTSVEGGTILRLLGTQGIPATDPPDAVFPGSLFSLFTSTVPDDDEVRGGFGSIKVRLADSSGTYPEAVTTLTYGSTLTETALP